MSCAFLTSDGRSHKNQGDLELNLWFRQVLFNVIWSLLVGIMTDSEKTKSEYGIWAPLWIYCLISLCLVLLFGAASRGLGSASAFSTFLSQWSAFGSFAGLAAVPIVCAKLPQTNKLYWSVIVTIGTVILNPFIFLVAWKIVEYQRLSF